MCIITIIASTSGTYFVHGIRKMVTSQKALHKAACAVFAALHEPLRDRCSRSGGGSVLRWMWRICALVLLLIYISFWISAPTVAQGVRGPIYAVEVQGPVTSVVIDYLRSALQRAQSADATALLITINSTGGVLRDMRPFAGEIAQAKVPVVVYVAPAGTNSGAVGAFFLSAAHISVLAPGTSFGTQEPLTKVDTTLSQQTRDLVLDSVASQLRDWNAAQGRNTQWIDRAVREGVILNNEQATTLQPQ